MIRLALALSAATFVSALAMGVRYNNSMPVVVWMIGVSLIGLVLAWRK